MPQRILRTLMIAMLTLLFGGGTMTFSIKPSYADVKVEGRLGPPLGEEVRGKNAIIISISKTISKADSTFFEQHAADFETQDLIVYLDSTGGDVDAAMQIGRMIRKNEGSTSVSPKNKCYSSCALIYIAGVRRFNGGRIGLHRPYFATLRKAVSP